MYSAAQIAGLCLLVLAPFFANAFQVAQNPARSVRHAAGNFLSTARRSMASDTNMGASVEPAGNSSVIIKLNVPGQATKECWAQALVAFTQAVEFEGFRKGSKIPEQTIVNQVGEDSVKSEALHILTNSVLKSAVQSSGVNAIGQAQLVRDSMELVKDYSPGKELLMEIKIDVFPTIEYTGDYKGLQVAVDKVPFDQERYDQALLSLRKRQTVLTEVDEPAAEGMSAIVDMAGYLRAADGSRGEPLPELASGDQVEVVLEPGRYTEGLYEGVLGMRAGEEKDVVVTLPARFSVGNLANKEAIFAIKCSAVKVRTLPEPNDEFAASIREGLTFAELNEEIKAAVGQENADIETQNRNRALEEALIEQVKIEIPETLVVEQAREKYAMMMADMKTEGSKSDEELKEMITPENFEKYKEIVRPSVTRGLAASIILADIAKREELAIDELEVEDQLQLVKNQARGDPNFDEEGVRARIEATLQKNIVLDWLADKGTITWNEPPEERPAI
mmetsp:Transcript_11961/g.20945  ORF Transcript_11961/g.20945 Transcript_11961/m.20945 type:complete len:505 (+) Transcript_11961:60-1574(+)